MWFNQQTLQHKEKHFLVALVPKALTTWAWNPIGENVLFKDEDGNVFEDSPSNYTHIVDWSGRVAPGTPTKDGKPDISLKKYVGVSEEVRKQKEQEYLERWYQWLLNELDNNDHVDNPFADGRRHHQAEVYCMDKLQAKYMYDHNTSEKYPLFGFIPKFFYHKGELWATTATSGLFKIKKNPEF